jgi:tyrosinase
MRTGFLTATLAVVAGVSALPSPQVVDNLLDNLLSTVGNVVPKLDLNIFASTPKFVQPIPLEVAKQIFEEHNATHADDGTPEPRSIEARATCGNVRTRIEWDSYPDSSKQNFVDSIKCLMGRAPTTGRFPAAKSRYEELVALHQTLTPNVHGNSKFLLWHRYYTWVFEDVLRAECGLAQAMPWFDETRYAGRFAQSSIFSSRWLGGLSLGGNCVTDGVSKENAVLYNQIANPNPSNSPTSPSTSVPDPATKSTASPATATAQRRNTATPTT